MISHQMPEKTANAFYTLGQTTSPKLNLNTSKMPLMHENQLHPGFDSSALAGSLSKQALSPSITQQPIFPSQRAQDTFNLTRNINMSIKKYADHGYGAANINLNL